jgi:hypothetical protein
MMRPPGPPNVEDRGRGIAASVQGDNVFLRNLSLPRFVGAVLAASAAKVAVSYLLGARVRSFVGEVIGLIVFFALLIWVLDRLGSGPATKRDEAGPRRS